MKKNIAIVVLLFSTLFLGFRKTEQQKSSPNDEKPPEEVSVIIADIPKEKLEVESAQVELTAKQYYEKAFKLFLMTLGLKMSEDQREELAELIENPQNYVDKSSSAQAEDKDIRVEKLAREYDFKPPRIFAEVLKNNDMSFDHVRDIGMMKRLSRKVLKDPTLYYARSKYVKRIGPLKKIMGDYRGRLFRVAGTNKGRTDEILLSMKFFTKDEKVEGDFSLALSSEGKTYSNSRGNGGNGNVRIRRGAIIIEAGPGSFFHFADKRFELANFYTNGELVGFAKLEKI